MHVHTLYTHTHTHAHTHMHAQTFIHTTCIHIYTCTQTCTYVHTCMCIHTVHVMNTHIHTVHIRTYSTNHTKTNVLRPYPFTENMLRKDMSVDGYGRVYPIPKLPKRNQIIHVVSVHRNKTTYANFRKKNLYKQNNLTDNHLKA